MPYHFWIQANVPLYSFLFFFLNYYDCSWERLYRHFPTIFSMALNSELAIWLVVLPRQYNPVCPYILHIVNEFICSWNSYKVHCHLLSYLKYIWHKMTNIKHSVRIKHKTSNSQSISLLAITFIDWKLSLRTNEEFRYILFTSFVCFSCNDVFAWLKKIFYFPFD